MYPRPFAYERADSLPSALALLASDAEAKLLAGGQSLVPMMTLGLVAPPLVIDIGQLDLSGFRTDGDAIRIGALTRHRELELGADARRRLPLAAEAAALIGNPRVRNRGTLGGSLSHADPTAELAAVALAYEARIVLAGPSGERSVPVASFLRGYFETAAEPDELLVGVELDPPPDGSGCAFIEVQNRADDYATAAAAVILSLDADGRTCRTARIVVVGAGGVPVRVSTAEDACRGEVASEALARAVAAAVADAIEPEDDPFCSATHRRRCASACAARAVATAFARAQDRTAA